MLRLLHFSDLHNQTKSVDKAIKLANKISCDVIALTGDFTSGCQRQVDMRFNELRKRNLLSVPGNHDFSKDAYNLLTRWQTNCPWIIDIDNVWFLGLDSNTYLESDKVKNLLCAFKSNHNLPSLLVIMIHHTLDHLKKQLTEILTKTFTDCKKRPRLLILHGHMHLRNFSSFWAENENIGLGWQACISHVCSSQGEPGGAHFITWNGQRLWHQYRYLDNLEVIRTA